jgi:CheY-like chemotaxis protein
LPGLNGYDVARRLRVDPEVPALTLVALTGFGQDEDRRPHERRRVRSPSDEAGRIRRARGIDRDHLATAVSRG